jgi:hypothetical protein
MATNDNDWPAAASIAASVHKMAEIDLSGLKEALGTWTLLDHFHEEKPVAGYVPGPAHDSHLGDDSGMPNQMSCPDCRALWDHRWALVRVDFVTRLIDLGVGRQLRDKIMEALDEAGEC